MKNRHVVLLAGTLCFAGSTTAARGAAKDYDFKDPKGVNAIVFVLDSTLEPIVGVADGIAGTVSFDPKNPEATTGTITLATRSIHTANRGMKNKIQASDWLDGKRYPTISVAFKKILKTKSLAPNAVRLDTIADVTIKGITKEIALSVTATHMPGKLSSRLHGASGDLLVLRSNFKIKRKDFNVKPDMGNDAVAEEIELRVSIVGSWSNK